MERWSGVPFSTVSGTGTGIFLTRSRAGLLTIGVVVSVATLRRWPLSRCAAWWVAWPLWGRAARFLLSLLGGRVCGLAVWPCVFGRLAFLALLCWGGLCVVGGRAWAAWLRFLGPCFFAVLGAGVFLVGGFLGGGVPFGLGGCGLVGGVLVGCGWGLVGLVLVSGCLPGYPSLPGRPSFPGLVMALLVVLVVDVSGSSRCALDYCVLFR